MRLEIDREVLEEEQLFPHMDQLLISGLLEGRHRWESADFREVEATRWARSLGDRHRRSLRALLGGSGAGVPSGPPTVRICLNPRPHLLELDPRWGVHWLLQPVRILVEDPRGHGALVERLLLDVGAKESDAEPELEEVGLLVD